MTCCSFRFQFTSTLLVDWWVLRFQECRTNCVVPQRVSLSANNNKLLHWNRVRAPSRLPISLIRLILLIDYNRLPNIFFSTFFLSLSHFERSKSCLDCAASQIDFSQLQSLTHTQLLGNRSIFAWLRAYPPREGYGLQFGTNSDFNLFIQRYRTKISLFIITGLNDERVEKSSPTKSTSRNRKNKKKKNDDDLWIWQANAHK